MLKVPYKNVGEKEHSFREVISQAWTPKDRQCKLKWIRHSCSFYKESILYYDFISLLEPGFTDGVLSNRNIRQHCTSNKKSTILIYQELPIMTEWDNFLMNRSNSQRLHTSMFQSLSGRYYAVDEKSNICHIHSCLIY